MARVCFFRKEAFSTCQLLPDETKNNATHNSFSVETWPYQWTNVTARVFCLSFGSRALVVECMLNGWSMEQTVRNRHNEVTTPHTSSMFPGISIIYPHEYRKNQANVSKYTRPMDGMYNSYILKFQRQKSHLWTWDATSPTHGWTETSRKLFELLPMGSMCMMYLPRWNADFNGKFW